MSNKKLDGRSDDHLRCEICDWCKATGGTTYSDQSSRTEMGRTETSTPLRVILRADGAAICNVCYFYSVQNKFELDLTDEEEDGTLGKEYSNKRLDRYYRGYYQDSINGQDVIVRVYNNEPKKDSLS